MLIALTILGGIVWLSLFGYAVYRSAKAFEAFMNWIVGN